MTAMKTKLPIADGRLPMILGKGALDFMPIQKLKFKIQNRWAFTLVELLAVIFVIGVLAAFTIPVLHGVARLKYINTAKAEMGQLETAIDSYHATYGFYPPDSDVAPLIPSQPQLNQLYYELTGTTNIGSSSAPVFQTLDGNLPILPSSAVQHAFGVGGFVNCSKSGGEDSTVARDFLSDLKATQVSFLTNGITGPQGIHLLVCSVGGPDAAYEPLGVAGLNPWRYKSSGTLTNNPGSYELWVKLVIGEKTNLVCNWDSQVQVNSQQALSLP